MAAGSEILATIKSVIEQTPYERNDCPDCGWPIEKSHRGLHCELCGWTDKPIVRKQIV